MTVTATGRTLDRVSLTAELTAAYVSRNRIPIAELPTLIASVYGALTGLAAGASIAPDEEPPGHATSAQIRKSVTPDALISFIDGKPYKTLKRHLTKHGLDPDTYRAQYGLQADYPMVAPSYSKLRGALARGIGLGNRRGGRRKAG
jgi:predicted transcriptional regulator